MKYYILILLFTSLYSISTAKEEIRIALLIGNGAYTSKHHSPLKTPSNDIDEMEDILSSRDFKVLKRKDVNKRQMVDVIDDFIELIRRKQHENPDKKVISLFYYAGHGNYIEDDDESYLVPVNSRIRYAEHFENRAYPVSELLKLLRGSKNYLNIVMLDACRSNFVLKKNIGQTIYGGDYPPGLFEGVKSHKLDERKNELNMLVSFSTSKEGVAESGEGKGANVSPYLAAFKEAIQEKGKASILDLFALVHKKTVNRSVNNPELDVKFYDNFHFDKQPTSLYHITFKIVDKYTNKPINNVLLDFSECNLQKKVTNLRGTYDLEITEDFNCNLTISKEGYQSKKIRIQRGNSFKKTIEIGLTSDRNYYTGEVKISKRLTPVPNAHVKAVKLETGESIQALTNNLGRYVLDLEPFKSYNIKISKKGYLDSDFTIHTMNGAHKELGIQYLIPSNSTQDLNLSTESNKDEPIDWVSKGVTEVYAVQVGVYTNPNIKHLSLLKEFGNVFYERVDKIYKYKVGSFKTKSEAEKIKRTIIQKTGMYKNAWVGKIIDPKIINETYIPDDLYSESESKNNTSSNELKNTASLSGVTYKILLGSYSKPEYFDQSKYSDLGVIETQLKTINHNKSITQFLLGSYKSKEKAEKIKKIVRDRGLSQAFIITYKNGRPIRMN